MKIGIDIRLYHQTGVGTYIRNLIHELSQLKEHEKHEFILFGLSDVKDLPLPSKHFSLQIVDAHWHSLQEQTTFLKELNKHQLDLMHFTYFSYPAFYKRPFVITIHDLIPLHFKSGQASAKNPIMYEVKHAVYKFLLHNAIKKSRKIIVPSNAVKEDVLTTYKQAVADKISVTYEGINQELLNVTPNEKLSQNYANPFFIYVGNFYPHKNVERLIRAFSESKIPHSLILIGPQDYFSKRMQHLVKALHMENRIQFFFGAQLSDLSYFYQHAAGLIHPSLAEGFGLTLIEAQYFGCPVVASDIPVINEVMGQEFISFDPKNALSIQSAIEKASQNNSRSTEMHDFTSQLLQKFSFADMAKKTLSIYESSS